MGNRFFVSCGEDDVESVVQELRRRGCIIVTQPNEAYGLPGIVNFVIQSPSERVAWVKTVDGVVDVHEDYRFDLS